MSKHSIGVVRVRRAVAFGVTATLLFAACGGSSKGGSGSNSASSNKIFQGSGVQIAPPPKGGSSNPDANAGTPVRGGTATYALEAEDTNGYCLPEGQLDISGEQVVRAVYDTLTIPGADKKYHPNLAKSVTHSADNMTWTIELRSGITFSDGSPLTATVVKNNIDAWRGSYPGRSPLLFIFVYSNIASVTTTGPLTVTVTMKKPWIDFDGFLYNQNRSGIMGQSQLDDPKTCATKLVGTGPFQLKSWKVNEKYVFVPNPHYWQKAPDGKPYPYLSELDMVPIVDDNQRTQALETGSVQGIMTSAGKQITTLRSDASAGKLKIITSVVNTELSYLLLNSTQAPFNDQSLRTAAAEAIDMKTANKVRDHDVAPTPIQPFAPDSMAYLNDPGYPSYNPANAKKLVSAYTSAHGNVKPAVTLISTPDADTVKLAEQYQQYLNLVGFNASIQNVEQAKLIDTAVSKKFGALLWRNHGGIDPDEQYIWWHSGSAVNFGGIKDPVIDCLLDVGRSTVDTANCLKDPALNKDQPGLSSLSPTDRPAIYQAMNKRFGSEVWNVWGPTYSPWSTAMANNFYGVFGPNLPDGSAPWTALLNGIAVQGLWVSK